MIGKTSLILYSIMKINQKGISNTRLAIIIAIILIVAVAYFIFDRRSADNQNKMTEKNQPASIANELSPNVEINKPQSDLKNNMHIITIKTNFGEIQFETYNADAPKTVNNFITLAQKGFYNNLIFHRVIKGFMIQGGDPNGNGSGGPGYQFEDELNPQAESYKAGYKKGVVAMANAGPNTNGSQFFIMLEDYPLPNNYTIFGKVVKGQDVIDKIGSVATDSSDKPLSSVKMEKVTVENK